MQENIDKTINAICDWITSEVTENKKVNQTTTDMTKALADLITARAGVQTNRFQ